jgi:hypothetical protein
MSRHRWLTKLCDFKTSSSEDVDWDEVRSSVLSKFHRDTNLNLNITNYAVMKMENSSDAYREVTRGF